MDKEPTCTYTSSTEADHELPVLTAEGDPQEGRAVHNGCGGHEPSGPKRIKQDAEGAAK